MRDRNAITWKYFLYLFDKNKDWINVVCGTGALAVDMKRKLELLRLPVEPCLVGEFDDVVKGIVSYVNLPKLYDNPEKYRFIVCYDEDEFALIAPTCAIIHGMFGKITYPNADRHLLCVMYDLSVREQLSEGWRPSMFGKLETTVNNSICVCYGNDSADSYKIAVFGSSNCNDVILFSNPTFGECLYHSMSDKIPNVNILNYSSFQMSIAEQIPRILTEIFLTDKKIDLILLPIVLAFDLDIHNYRSKNLIGIRNTAGNYFSLSYKEDALLKPLVGTPNLGIDFDIALTDIAVEQLKVISIMAKLRGVKLIPCFLPNSQLVTAEKNKKASTRSSRYLKSVVEERDLISKQISQFVTVKDYSDAFDDGDIFDFYCDEGHYTPKGCEVLTRKIAIDIGGYVNGNS